MVSIKKLFLLIVMTIFSSGISAAGLSFRLFDSPAERVEKFKSYFKPGLVLNGQLIAGASKVDLPPGEWVVAGAYAWVGAIRNMDSDEISYKNPHGEAFLFQLTDGEVRRVFTVIIPLGPIWNRTWQSSVPDFCDPDWNASNKFWQDIHSSNAAALDCSVVYYESALSWDDFLIDTEKLSLRDLDMALNYLSAGVFISKSAGVYLVSYSEWIDSVEYSSKSEFEEKNREKINDMKIKVKEIRERLRRNVD